MAQISLILPNEDRNFQKDRKRRYLNSVSLMHSTQENDPESHFPIIIVDAMRNVTFTCV